MCIVHRSGDDNQSWWKHPLSRFFPLLYWATPAENAVHVCAFVDPSINCWAHARISYCTTRLDRKKQWIFSALEVVKKKKKAVCNRETVISPESSGATFSTQKLHTLARVRACLESSASYDTTRKSHNTSVTRRELRNLLLGRFFLSTAVARRSGSLMHQKK